MIKVAPSYRGEWRRARKSCPFRCGGASALDKRREALPQLFRKAPGASVRTDADQHRGTLGDPPAVLGKHRILEADAAALYLGQ
jgi:hypothetical protein